MPVAFQFQNAVDVTRSNPPQTGVLPLQFHEHSQDFIGAHDAALSVAARIHNQIVGPSRSIAATQPKLQPMSWS